MQWDLCIAVHADHFTAIQLAEKLFGALPAIGKSAADGEGFAVPTCLTRTRASEPQAHLFGQELLNGRTILLLGVLATTPSLDQLVNRVEPVGNGPAPTLRLAQVAHALVECVAECIPLACSIGPGLFGITRNAVLLGEYRKPVEKDTGRLPDEFSTRCRTIFARLRERPLQFEARLRELPLRGRRGCGGRVGTHGAG